MNAMNGDVPGAEGAPRARVRRALREDPLSEIAAAAEAAGAADAAAAPDGELADALAGALADGGTPAAPPARDRPAPSARTVAALPSRLAGIEVQVTVEVGASRMPLHRLMAIEPGELLPLDRVTDEPVDVLVNGRPFARGEVVAIGDRYGVRLTEIVDPGEAQP